jgi:hypothetical protein
VDGVGSDAAGLGVAVPDGAADRFAGVEDFAGVCGGRRISTVYEGVLESATRGAVRIAVWSTSS